MKKEWTATNNERIARAIILSNTNQTQRDCLGWIGNIECGIVAALDTKDARSPSMGKDAK